MPTFTAECLMEVTSYERHQITVEAANKEEALKLMNMGEGEMDFIRTEEGEGGHIDIDTSTLKEKRE